MKHCPYKMTHTIHIHKIVNNVSYLTMYERLIIICLYNNADLLSQYFIFKYIFIKLII